MSARSDVLLWAQRVLSRKDAAPHVLLELPADAGADAIQEAFHAIARMAHPDLHRATLDAAELELVTEAYARAAAAYQDLRRPGPPGAPGARGKSATHSGAAGAAGAMSSKALVYYRKAELALRRGDLRGAALQLKLAIASDPHSPLLRTALAEVEAELAKA